MIKFVILLAVRVTEIFSGFRVFGPSSVDSPGQPSPARMYSGHTSSQILGFWARSRVLGNFVDLFSFESLSDSRVSALFAFLHE